MQYALQNMHKIWEKDKKHLPNGNLEMKHVKSDK